MCEPSNLNNIQSYFECIQMQLNALTLYTVHCIPHEIVYNEWVYMYI